MKNIQFQSINILDYKKRFFDKKKNRRVNIKEIISRYKREKAKEKKETIVFFSLTTALLLVSGVIISL